MAYYEPPTEQLPIFNPSAFVNEDEALTLASASRYFLKYPVAQGTENLQDTNVNGVLTANNDIILNNTATFTWNNADYNYLLNGQYPKAPGTGVNNTAFGVFNLTNITTGSENCCLGDQCGQSITSGSDNTIVGTTCGTLISTGSNNTILGQNAGEAITTSSNNTLIGHNAGPYLTGTNVVCVGDQSNYLITDTDCSNSTAVGAQSSNNNFTFSTALGFGATNTSANQIMLGRNTETTYHPGNVVFSPTTNIQWDRTDLNYLINDNAGSKSITSGQGNVALGHNCLDLVNSGTNNVGIGRSAGRTISTGDSNICIGAFAGDVITTGVGSVMIGVNAGSKTNNTSVAIGRNALQNLTTGQYNIAIGEATSQNMTTQNQTTCIGYNACANGGNNTTAYGFQSLQNATGGSNTAVGNQSGKSITTGSGNLCLGNTANSTGNTTLTNSCAIGASSSNANFSSSVALGYQATNTANNQIRLGTATETVSCPGTLTFKTTSDNTNGTYYIPFSKTAAGTEGQLYIDDTTGPLTYNPSTSTLTCAVYDGPSATSDVYFANSTTTTGRLIIAQNLSGSQNCSILANGGYAGTCFVFGGSVSSVLYVRGNIRLQYGLKTTTSTYTLANDMLGYTTSKTTGWAPTFGASPVDINSITIDGTTIAFGIYRIEVYLNYSSDIDNTIQLGVSTTTATFQNPSINKFSPAGKNDGMYYCKTISAYSSTQFFIVADGLAGSTTTLDTSGTDGCNITLTRL